MLVGDLLPGALLNRSTKARFDQVFWTEHSRELVADWQGEGVDPEIVDLDRLRAEWASPTPEAHTFTLLQSVWLTRARAAGRLPRGSDSQPRGRLSSQAGSEVSSSSASGRAGGSRSPRWAASRGEPLAAPGSGRASTRSPQARKTQPQQRPAPRRSGRAAAASARARRSSRSARRRPRRSAASARRSIERGPASGRVAVDDQHVVAQHVDAGAREPRERRALARLARRRPRRARARRRRTRPACMLSRPTQRAITAAAGARYGCTSSSGRTGCGTRNTHAPLLPRSIRISPPLRSRSRALSSSTYSSGASALPTSAAIA